MNHISKASDMSTTGKLFIRGGSRETRSQLLHDRSKELIQQLMNEAADTHSSVQHTFRGPTCVHYKTEEQDT